MSKCFVCGVSGVILDTRICVTDETHEEPLLIGQCPVCKRFICSRHSEQLDLSQKKRHFRFLPGHPKSAVRVLCCPFDPGVALGESSE